MQAPALQVRGIPVEQEIQMARLIGLVAAAVEPVELVFQPPQQMQVALAALGCNRQYPAQLHTTLVAAEELIVGLVA
jgi:hypothetical protein